MWKFLTAEWRDLIIANYEVDPSVLANRIPHGTELDLHDGRCFVSLVGFMFLNTRVLGVPIPGHVNFEEVNLRFYIRRELPNEIRRGVCFIKETVPKPAIAFVARTLFGEPYETARMSNSIDSEKVSYRWINSDDVNSIEVTRGEALGIPQASSHEEFIVEHYWGYTKRGTDRTDEYKVEHPKWELCENRNPEIRVSFAGSYGKELAFLQNRPPYSILLAQGSGVIVYKGARLNN